MIVELEKHLLITKNPIKDSEQTEEYFLSVEENHEDGDMVDIIRTSDDYITIHRSELRGLGNLLLDFDNIMNKEKDLRKAIGENES